MGDLLGSISAAASGMNAQAQRLKVTSENIANADTPGYRRKTLPFHTSLSEDVAVKAGRVRLDQAELPDVYDPAHPLAGEDGYYKGSSVDLMLEIADAREAQRSYEANLKVFDQARNMASQTLSLLNK
ncbi:flagellar basal body rod protein FlgC [Paracoccaceae bacterium GXU_MW_L88]